MASKHCDDYIDDTSAPQCLRAFLAYNRLPAFEQSKRAPSSPRLFATYKGERVRVVMASRFGDVGVTRELDREHGYETRVWVGELINFSETE